MAKKIEVLEVKVGLKHPLNDYYYTEITYIYNSLITRIDRVPQKKYLDVIEFLKEYIPTIE